MTRGRRSSPSPPTAWPSGRAPTDATPPPSSRHGRTRSEEPARSGSPPARPRLKPEELTILRSAAEAIAEVLASVPEQLHHTLAEIGDDVASRARLATEEWSSVLTEAFEAMRRLLSTDAPAGVATTPDRALAVVRADRPDASDSERLARGVLRLALEQRRIRHLNLGLSLAGDPQ